MEQGSLHIQSQQNILLHGAGQGQMQVGQPTGGMFVAPSGNVYLSSPQLTLEAPEINIYGMHVVNSQQPSFQYVPITFLENEKEKKEKKQKKKSETLTEEFKLFIATVYGEAGNCSEAAWQAVGSSIINRVNNPYFSYMTANDTVTDVIQYGGYDAYSNKNSPFMAAWEYLEKETKLKPERLGAMIAILEPIYYDKELTTDADLYYSPLLQHKLHKKFA